MEELDLGVDFNCSQPHEAHPNVSAITKLYAFIIFSFQSTFKVSDSAVTALLILLVSFLRIMSKSYHGEQLLVLCDELPRSVYSARKILQQGNHAFNRYACWPSCSTLYPWPNEEIRINSTCNYIQYHDHPQRHHRQPCGTKLVKPIKTCPGSFIIHPLLNYCYKSVIESLQNLMLRPDCAQL